MNGVVKRDKKRQRVLAVDAATEGESIEEMVSRLERDLDEEFGCFGRMKEPCPATVAVEIANAATITAEVPAQRVPEAAAELEALKIENTNFSRSFVDTAAESARSRVPEATPVSTQKAAAELKTLQNENEQFNNSFVDPAAEPARSRVPEHKPPEIECYRRPPRARDKNHVQQVQGCCRGRTYQKVSAKGVLDIGYLCPRPRVRGRIPIHVWCPPTGTQRARLHGRSVFGWPAQ